jgi:hypothetical protein
MLVTLIERTACEAPELSRSTDLIASSTETEDPTFKMEGLSEIGVLGIRKQVVQCRLQVETFDIDR